MKVKKKQKNTCEKVHVHIYFWKILRRLKVISSYIFEIQEQLLSRNNSFFLNKKFEGFWNKKLKILDQIKQRFSFRFKINIRKMTSNKHVDLRKTENFVRSKEKRTNFRKPCNNFKIVNQHLINPIFIYEIWIASKVSRLNAFT